MRSIELIHEATAKATNSWPTILARLDIEVPDSPRKHAPCPACGGKDRFRFDDNGRGSFICNQCGAGDGLELVKKVKGCNTTEAAHLVADVIGIDYRTGGRCSQGGYPKNGILPTGHNNQDKAKQRQRYFTAKYQALAQQTVQGESQYIASKGLESFTFPMLPAGRLLLPLVDESGKIVAAQTITLTGDKKLLSGSAKKGAFYAVNSPQSTNSIILAEGLATALSAHLINPDALTIVAIDSGNLLPVGQVMRGKYPQAQIIIAADNDHLDGHPNTGKIAAEKAALAISGWVSLPPTEYKADWNDYHQQYGIAATTQAFTESLYQPKGECGKNRTPVIKTDRMRAQHNRTLDLSQMAASQRGKVLAEYYGELAVNPESGNVYHYHLGVWERITDNELRRSMGIIFDSQDTPYSPKGIDAAIEAMKLQIPVVGEPQRGIIGFENGVYDLTQRAFSAHRPDNYLMNHNGITYTPPVQGESLSRHAPHFNQWLTHVTVGDSQKAERVKAALFMVLAKRHDWQLFIEVTGEGGSGKSIFSSIATLLAGEHNTASGNMVSLDTARGRAQFVGKSLITLPDQTRYVGEGAGIKAITGGDRVEIDGKYEKQFSTVLHAVVLATNNEPMTFTERNGGIARRRVIFPFNAPVADKDKDPDLMVKIRQEIPVIIRHLLALFAEQDKAKALLVEQRESNEALAVKRGTDPVIDMCAALYFMSEPKGLMMGGGTWSGQPEPRTYLYQLYLVFLEYHGLGKPLSVEKFARAMKNAAKEYRSEYLTRKVKGRTQTNVSITELAEEFIPRAFGIAIPED